jgi:hypothetical protein
MGFLAWGFSPEAVPTQDYGEAISYAPMPVGKSNGVLESELTTYQAQAVTPSMQYGFVARTAEGGPYWLGYLNSRQPVGFATTQYIEAPPRPISAAQANAIYQTLSGQVAHGAAPTSGIYTGVEDFV